MLIDVQDSLLLLEAQTPPEYHALTQNPNVIVSGGKFAVYWSRLGDFSGFPMVPASQEAAGRIQNLATTRLRADAKLTFLEGVDLSAEREVFSPEFTPRDYQLKGIRFLRTVRRAILGDDMGLGKTVQAAAAVLVDWYEAAATKDGNAGGRLVVVTWSGLRRQWKREITSAFVVPGSTEPAFPSESVMVYDGSPASRKLALKSFTDPHYLAMVLSYELLIRDLDALLDVFGRVGVRALIFDESSRVKNPATSTFAAAKRLADAFPASSCFLLNGTPIENAAEDLWAQVNIVCPSLFPSQEAFDRRYVRRRQIRTSDGRFFNKIVGYQNLGEIPLLLRDVMVRRTCKDVAEQLPEIIVGERTVQLGEAQRAEYSKIENDAELTSDVALNALIRATLFVRDERGRIISTKADEIMALVAEIPKDDQIVVCTESAVFAKHLHQRFRDADERAELIEGETPDSLRSEIASAFAARSCRILVGTGAIERGLNLQTANWLVNADLPWNPAKWAQRVGRVRRLGSRHDVVRIVNVYAEDTLESYVKKAVYQKQNLFVGVFGSMDLKPVDPNGLLQGFRGLRRREEARS